MPTAKTNFVKKMKSKQPTGTFISEIYICEVMSSTLFKCGTRYVNFLFWTHLDIDCIWHAKHFHHQKYISNVQVFLVEYRKTLNWTFNL